MRRVVSAAPGKDRSSAKEHGTLAVRPGPALLGIIHLKSRPLQYKLESQLRRSLTGLAHRIVSAVTPGFPVEDVGATWTITSTICELWISGGYDMHYRTEGLLVPNRVAALLRYADHTSKWLLTHLAGWCALANAFKLKGRMAARLNGGGALPRHLRLLLTVYKSRATLL